MLQKCITCAEDVKDLKTTFAFISCKCFHSKAYNSSFMVRVCESLYVYAHECMFMFKSVTENTRGREKAEQAGNKERVRLSHETDQSVQPNKN